MTVLPGDPRPRPLTPGRALGLAARDGALAGVAFGVLCGVGAAVLVLSGPTAAGPRGVVGVVALVGSVAAVVGALAGLVVGALALLLRPAVPADLGAPLLAALGWGVPTLFAAVDGSGATDVLVLGLLPALLGTGAAWLFGRRVERG